MDAGAEFGAERKVDFLPHADRRTGRRIAEQPGRTARLGQMRAPESLQLLLVERAIRYSLPLQPAPEVAGCARRGRFAAAQLLRQRKGALAQQFD